MIAFLVSDQLKGRLVYSKAKASLALVQSTLRHESR